MEMQRKIRIITIDKQHTFGQKKNREKSPKRIFKSEEKKNSY
jgi:hypothetical protein